VGGARRHTPRIHGNPILLNLSLRNKPLPRFESDGYAKYPAKKNIDIIIGTSKINTIMVKTILF
jgi:hypothetical protein